MLNYRINRDKIVNDINKISFNRYEISRNPMKLLLSANNTEEYNDKYMATFYCDSLDLINKGDRVIITSTINVTSDDMVSNSTYLLTNVHTVTGLDEISQSFTVMFNGYDKLGTNNIYQTTIDNEDYIYVDFDKNHFFTLMDEEINIMVEYNQNSYIIKNFTYVNNKTLRINKNNVDDINLQALLNNVNLYRKNLFFNNSIIKEIYCNYLLNCIPVSLSSSFSTDMVKEDSLQVYLKESKEKSINPIVDMEKDVYHPMIVKNKNEYIPVYNIKFNLHFRQHRGDNWLCDNESYWNGTYVDEKNGKIQFVPDFFSYNNKSEQSDLLTYLNFTNNDVKYQKNKLKKSFLRLSFYDSTNPANQNLLAHSTIFMNSGDYYAKFIKYLEQDGYYTILYKEDDITPNGKSVNQTAIRVNRETSTKDNEDLRLSSQITVSDKYNSNSSSEGFYLYLWKDNNMGIIPQDIYLKVEFNHAGYGRSIPFMMPYWDKQKWGGKTGVKTFDQIVNDWNEETNTDGKYGIKQYLKYSYIHFKYRYNKKLKKHIYYLDDDTYGNSSDTSNTIVLNLYEAKMI